jgi:hypothetical protein
LEGSGVFSGKQEFLEGSGKFWKVRSFSGKQEFLEVSGSFTGVL